ncbi:uncharacterized protein LACBIDRAFT_312292 [Laccaria bicolor S238N-H82]|uniref:Predicted protein n=1 Tax=Laccaria bicolor (strain S238N-H82 / ATCC MYA-4686) TaxID=486041 RepID=B0DVW4_LACBS|nr:uncharacterized protein LACBIDRAFT_312292 [Laccaria bicolor S238N-H82]EDR01204.1 predicted protein [Laccaria bicolor S238N-H82]|eukprot:XP_001888080.1 predicted protein [Laccaria bicolor S238N-H82]
MCSGQRTMEHGCSRMAQHRLVVLWLKAPQLPGAMQRAVGLHVRTPASVVWPVLSDDPIIRFSFEAFLCA